MKKKSSSKTIKRLLLEKKEQIFLENCLGWLLLYSAFCILYSASVFCFFFRNKNISSSYGLSRCWLVFNPVPACYSMEKFKRASTGPTRYQLGKKTKCANPFLTWDKRLHSSEPARLKRVDPGWKNEPTRFQPASCNHNFFY